jgi:hypothetical protein
MRRVLRVYARIQFAVGELSEFPRSGGLNHSTLFVCAPAVTARLSSNHITLLISPYTRTARPALVVAGDSFDVRSSTNHTIAFLRRFSRLYSLRLVFFVTAVLLFVQPFALLRNYRRWWCDTVLVIGVSCLFLGCTHTSNLIHNHITKNSSTSHSQWIITVRAVVAAAPEFHDPGSHRLSVE